MTPQLQAKIKKWTDAILHEDGHKLSFGSIRTLKMINDELATTALSSMQDGKEDEDSAWKWAAIFLGALQELVDLKTLKDTYGSRIEGYEKRKPLAWEKARNAIELWKKSDYGALTLDYLNSLGCTTEKPMQGK